MSLQGVKKHRVRVIGLSVNSSCSGRNIAIIAIFLDKLFIWR